MAPIHQIARTVHDGGVVLTANQRLSRTLRKSWDEQQRGGGRIAWPSPAILPLGSWIREQWAEGVIGGAVPPLTVLNTAQEAAVWESIIAESPHAAALLDFRGAARSAMEAWRLVQRYRVALDGRFAAHEDWSAFHAWAGAYVRMCASRGWQDEARLPDAVRDAIAHGSVRAPRRLLLAGFDEFTPQQRDLLRTLEDAGSELETLEAGEAASTVARRGSHDIEDELRGAAAWARDRLRKDPHASIGIVLLNVGVGRARLERVFDEALHPERMADPAASGPRRFHISIPDPLADFPLIDAALLAVRIAVASRWSLSDAGRLLRSPFLKGGLAEAADRAAVDARLRRQRRLYVRPDGITRLATQCPTLLGVVEGWRSLGPGFRGDRLPSRWISLFQDVLSAAGWPGDRVLRSAEFQVLEAWKELLRLFASLDATTRSMTCDDAVAQLEQLARETQFQPQDPGAPVQILGALEAAGARFDGLWVCGATDTVWPAPAHPHPFLPLSVQRDKGLPHSSPEREYAVAVRTFDRLQTSAPEIIVSWPRRAGDVELRRSPLIANLPDTEVRARARGREAVMLEQLLDLTAPTLETTRPRGGARLLKLQAACPFRAFAEVRLNAQPLDRAELGLSAADRGIAIHEALRVFWETVRDHATLTGMSGEQLRLTAETAVAAALEKVFRDSREDFDARFHDLEAVRLTSVLIEWAELEKERAPFTVAFNERERTIAIGGLELAARLDRIDQLTDGRQVILDYKTTAPSTNAWSGERPEEPQLPLYAISNEAPVAGIAFAQVGPEGLKFKGYAATAGILPGIRNPDRQGADLKQEINSWRGALEQLAAAFREGNAAVDPKKGGATCEQCGLMPLCRIHEAGAGREDADARA